jgi:hypothetical protein
MPITFINPLDNPYTGIDVDYFDKKALEKQLRHDTAHTNWSTMTQTIADNAYLDANAKNAFLSEQQSIFDNIISKNAGNLSKGYTDVLSGMEKVKSHPYHNLNLQQLNAAAIEDELKATYGSDFLTFAGGTPGASIRDISLQKDGKWATPSQIKAEVLQANPYATNLENQLREVAATIVKTQSGLNAQSGNQYYLASDILEKETLSYDDLNALLALPGVYEAFLANNPTASVDYRDAGMGISYKDMFSTREGFMQFAFGNIADKKVDNISKTKYFVDDPEMQEALKYSYTQKAMDYQWALDNIPITDPMLTGTEGGTEQEIPTYDDIINKETALTEDIIKIDEEITNNSMAFFGNLTGLSTDYDAERKKIYLDRTTDATTKQRKLAILEYKKQQETNISNFQDAYGRLDITNPKLDWDNKDEGEQSAISANFQALKDLEVQKANLEYTKQFYNVATELSQEDFLKTIDKVELKREGLDATNTELMNKILSKDYLDINQSYLHSTPFFHYKLDNGEEVSVNGYTVRNIINSYNSFIKENTPSSDSGLALDRIIGLYSDNDKNAQNEWASVANKLLKTEDGVINYDKLTSFTTTYNTLGDETTLDQALVTSKGKTVGELLSKNPSKYEIEAFPIIGSLFSGNAPIGLKLYELDKDGNRIETIQTFDASLNENDSQYSHYAVKTAWAASFGGLSNASTERQWNIAMSIYGKSRISTENVEAAASIFNDKSSNTKTIKTEITTERGNKVPLTIVKNKDGSVTVSDDTGYTKSYPNQSKFADGFLIYIGKATIGDSQIPELQGYVPKETTQYKLSE